MPLFDTLTPQLVIHEADADHMARGENSFSDRDAFPNNDVDNGDGLEYDPVLTHPLGVKPLGNKYLADKHAPDSKKASGPLFGALPDEVIMQLLETYLDLETLVALGATCRFLYAFCTYDDLWKALVFRHEVWCPPAWHGTWRRTLLATHKVQKQPTQPPPRAAVDCSRVFSDVLHRPFVCSVVITARFAADIPVTNQIARFDDLDAETFAAHWTDRPFVLTAAASVQAWPVLRTWTLETLRAQYGSTAFRAEAVDWPYSLYDAYMRDNSDESPLYLFDKRFAEKMALTVDAPAGEAAYTPPALFGPDLFAVLGAQRPAHRWLIVGPTGSGSTFHKDPNGTSAWNAVVQGAKYWVLFPPGARVPGVFVSDDEAEVTSPLSIAEWLLTFHAVARETPGCIEGVCRAGELLHVPSGWWHLVVNLEAGIALTQNFVPPAHLSAVLRFLHHRPTQVTGFARDAVPDPHALFVERLAAAYPEALQAAQAELGRRDQQRKRTWEAMRGGSNDDRDTTNTDANSSQKTGSGFTFGFCLNDAEEVP